MKIKKVPTETLFTFQPITIQITIETEEELNVLYKMSRFNISIPELVLDNTSQQEIIYEFLNVIHEKLGE